MMELVLGTKNSRDIEYLFGLNRPQYLHLKTCLKKSPFSSAVVTSLWL